MYTELLTLHLVVILKSKQICNIKCIQLSTTISSYDVTEQGQYLPNLFLWLKLKRWGNPLPTDPYTPLQLLTSENFQNKTLKDLPLWPCNWVTALLIIETDSTAEENQAEKAQALTECRVWCFKSACVCEYEQHIQWKTTQSIHSMAAETSMNL